jgi:gluconokinase
MITPPPKRGAKPTSLLLMGVSGVGKTTTGQRLAKTLGWTFRDADDFHPPANIEKMRSGQPLTDDDRWPWLDAIGAWLDATKARGEHTVVTCSALRRIYRERLLTGRTGVRLVFLKGSKALIADRLSRRTDHFMPPTLLESQFNTLEEPRRDERAIVVDVSMAPSRVVDAIVRYVEPQRRSQAHQAGQTPRPVKHPQRPHR